MEKEEYPGNCLALIVIKEDKVLIGRRRKVRGDGLYAFPGGRIRKYETPQACLLREMREEAGDDLEVELIDTKFPFETISECSDSGHYIVLFYRARYVRGEPKNTEDKCHGWEWHDWKNLPQPLFSGIQYLVDNNRDINEMPR